jgi:hypothetical protein
VNIVRQGKAGAAAATIAKVPADPYGIELDTHGGIKHILKKGRAPECGGSDHIPKALVPGARRI